MIDLKNELNKEQCEAATHNNGPLLVIAGAGSGKTRVITYRIANLVLNHGVKPWRIMAVTFTNKAAKEMLERIDQLIGHNTKCWISTFHSSCARLLRKYGERANINPKFTIYDDQDQKAMINRVIKELGLNPKQFPPRAIQSEINRSKRELISPADYEETDFYRKQVKALYELYEKRMNDASALDFGDLLYKTVRLMQNNTELKSEISGLFDYVLVDEFQDTNRVQLELVRLLTPHNNICVVGDDDQSIYSWRGADVSNILDFEALFAGAKVVTLDRNYRSTAHILQAAHGVVTKLVGRRKKKLWTDNQKGEPISFFETSDEREEGRLIAHAVQDLKDDGYPFSQQAIFYRTNAQSRVFEEVFRALNIPHRVVGGMRFYERAEVKDLIAYLRLIQNPADHTAFIRCINTPARGIGKTTIDRLVANSASLGMSAFEAIDHTVGTDLSKAAIKKLLGFKQMVELWRNDYEEGPFHLINKIVEEIEYIKRLETENTAEADARIENIKEFMGSVDDFVEEAEVPSLDMFLELVALQTDTDTKKVKGDEVTLMTVHSAKGLEFDVVFVSGLEEGLFPLIRQNDAILGESQEALDEERRLGYVAMTRAKQRLFLTRARTRKLYGQTKANPRSRFLSDVPIEIIQDLSPRKPKVSLVGHDRSSSNKYSQLSQNSSNATWFPGKRPSLGSSNSSGLTEKGKNMQSTEVWIDESFDQSSSGSSVFPGQTVRHPKFGVGKVLSLIPGSKPKVDVQFPGFGKKTILISYLDI